LTHATNSILLPSATAGCDAASPSWLGPCA
jgi:hypothetical protein